MTVNANNLIVWNTPHFKQAPLITVAATDSSGTTTSRFRVWVFDNPPTIMAGGNQTTPIGGTLSRTGFFSDPDPDDVFVASVDYGDGTQPLALSGKTFTLLHTYNDPGDHLVSVIIQDSQNGKGYGYFLVTITDISPVPTSLSEPPVVTVPVQPTVSPQKIIIPVVVIPQKKLPHLHKLIHIPRKVLFRHYIGNDVVLGTGKSLRI